MQDNYTIKNVTKIDDNYNIVTDKGVTFYLSTKYGVEPKIDDLLILHLTNGSTIRGVVLNGKTVFYKTEKELNKEDEEWKANYKKEKEERFLAEKERLDASFDKLPQSFKDRILKFRTNNPNFRVNYESYEMFTCEQAVIIAEVCKTPEEVQIFSKKSWGDQKAQVIDLSDNHSGNTIGAACALAYQYLKEESSVSKVIGALSPLVGSIEYGDVPNK